ncbi:hypothetical protein V8C86DRAFT_3026953 [Haematococcus lacustris]
MPRHAIKYFFPVLDLKNQVKPKTATLITAEDLEVSGMSGIFFSMLADVKLFHKHNYREALCLSCCLAGWDEGGRTSSTKRKAEGQAQGHQVAQLWQHQQQPGLSHLTAPLQTSHPAAAAPRAQLQLWLMSSRPALRPLT